MLDLIEKWKDKFDEYILIEDPSDIISIDSISQEDSEYIFAHCKNITLDIEKIEKEVGFKFPPELQKIYQAIGLFFIPGGGSHIRLGLYDKITNLKEHIVLDIDDVDYFYPKEDMFLVNHGFCIGTSHRDDDSHIFIAKNIEGNILLGHHNHDESIEFVEDFSIEALVKLLDKELDDYYNNWIYQDIKNKPIET